MPHNPKTWVVVCSLVPPSSYQSCVDSVLNSWTSYQDLSDVPDCIYTQAQVTQFFLWTPLFASLLLFPQWHDVS